MFKHCLIVFLVSMVPIIELRGAIPYGVGFGLPLWLTYIIAIVGNMLPVPLIYFFARKVLEWGRDKPVIGEILHLLPGKGQKGGEKLQGQGRPGPVLGAAAVCGHPPARHGGLDRHPGRQPPGYGFPQECAGLYGRSTAGGCIMGALSPLGVSAFGAIAG